MRCWRPHGRGTARWWLLGSARRAALDEEGSRAPATLDARCRRRPGGEIQGGEVAHLGLWTAVQRLCTASRRCGTRRRRLRRCGLPSIAGVRWRHRGWIHCCCAWQGPWRPDRALVEEARRPWAKDARGAAGVEQGWRRVGGVGGRPLHRARRGRTLRLAAARRAPDPAVNIFSRGGEKGSWRGCGGTSDGLSGKSRSTGGGTSHGGPSTVKKVFGACGARISLAAKIGQADINYTPMIRIQ